MVEVIPAILEHDWESVQKKAALVKTFTDTAQIDVMDGIFVSNLTFGDPLKLRELPLQLEVHLMITRPELNVLAFNMPNIFRIIFHAEAAQNIPMIIDLVKRMDKEIGIAINPDTPVHRIQEYFDRIDMVLVMGVHPGHSGQKFQYDVLEKIKEIKRLKPEMKVAVDGGVNAQSAKHIVTAGADTLDVNSYLFGQSDLQATYKALTGLDEQENQ